jgi:hypothetical protein
MSNAPANASALRHGAAQLPGIGGEDVQPVGSHSRAYPLDRRPRDCNSGAQRRRRSRIECGALHEKDREPGDPY